MKSIITILQPEFNFESVKDAKKIVKSLGFEYHTKCETRVLFGRNVLSAGAIVQTKKGEILWAAIYNEKQLSQLMQSLSVIALCKKCISTEYKTVKEAAKALEVSGKIKLTLYEAHLEIQKGKYIIALSSFNKSYSLKVIDQIHFKNSYHSFWR